MGETLAETPDLTAAADETDITGGLEASDVTAGADDTVEVSDVAEETPEAAAPTLTPEILASPEFQGAVAEYAQPYAQRAVLGLLEQLAQGGEPELGPPPDPLLSDDFPAEMLAWQEAREQQLIRQIQSAQQQEAETAWVNEQVDSLIDSTMTEFKIPAEDRGYFEYLANQLAEQSNLTGPEAARFVARQAAEQITARHAAIRGTTAEAVEAYKTGMGDVKNAPAEPGVGGAAVTMETLPTSQSEHTRRFLEARGLPYE